MRIFRISLDDSGAKVNCYPGRADGNADRAIMVIGKTGKTFLRINHKTVPAKGVGTGVGRTVPGNGARRVVPPTDIATVAYCGLAAISRLSDGQGQVGDHAAQAEQ